MAFTRKKEGYHGFTKFELVSYECIAHYSREKSVGFMSCMHETIYWEQNLVKIKSDLMRSHFQAFSWSNTGNKSLICLHLMSFGFKYHQPFSFRLLVFPLFFRNYWLCLAPSNVKQKIFLCIKSSNNRPIYTIEPMILPFDRTNDFTIYMQVDQC